MEFANQKGFFKDLYLNIQNSITDAEKSEFGKLATDSTRFEFIANLASVKNMNLQCDVTKKNSAEALKLKQQGNVAFQNKNWVAALTLYNVSLINTPEENGEEMSIIYANRSAALYHMEDYDRALRDISLAMPNYPKHLRYKLYERKARCHLAQKDFDDAMNAFKATVTHLDISNLSFEKRGKLEKDSQIMIKMLQQQEDQIAKFKQLKLKNKKADVSKYGLNSSVTFDYNPNEGRFAKAKKDIAIGDEILVENPHCAMLLEKFSKTHCQHCFKRSAAPLPCKDCCNVIFCSIECRNLATSTYHKFECGILKLLWNSGSSINCHMALRMMSQKSPNYFQDIKEQLTNVKFEDTISLPYTDYRKVFNLVRHETMRSEANFMQYTVMAYFLTLCLKISSFFDGFEAEFNFIGGLVLRNLQFLQFNTHEVYELVESETDKKSSKTVFIGGGIYPTLALFNHSCNPDIVRYYNGCAVHVHSVSNIKSGGTISENYGPIYSQHAIDDRKATLKEQYWFDCNCKACDENWPLYENMKTDEIRFRCDGDSASCNNIITIPSDCNEFMIKCIECGQFTNILKGLKAIQDTDMLDKTAKRLYSEKDYSGSYKKYLQILKLLDEVMAPPFRDYCNCQQSLKECLLQNGNKITM
ncbi:SET and MYND domain-containing protein 4 [Bradysia coprophila]|uniref:SET and MYND domain-containing protein 4 n=1 Tax=Bradysia coprophila TaxID=38358 RepID=UPI00187DA5CF|nr:SET and MYND domain-containing protein 4 [Bradysia coprophila]